MVEFSIREKEEHEYVDSIIDAVSWLGFGWGKEKGTDQDHALLASDSFDFMCKAAEHPIERTDYEEIPSKGVITWVGAADAAQAEIRLFTTEHPAAGGKEFLEALNPDSFKTIAAFVEPSLAPANADEKFQFERHGYFVADRVDQKDGKKVFNKITGLKDTWAK